MTKQEIIDKLDDYLMYVPGDEKLKDIYIGKQINKATTVYVFDKEKLQNIPIEELEQLLKYCKDKKENNKDIVSIGTVPINSKIVMDESKSLDIKGNGREPLAMRGHNGIPIADEEYFKCGEVGVIEDANSVPCCRIEDGLVFSIFREGLMEIFDIKNKGIFKDFKLEIDYNETDDTYIIEIKSKE